MHFSGRFLATFLQDIHHLERFLQDMQFLDRCVQHVSKSPRSLLQPRTFEVLV